MRNQHQIGDINEGFHHAPCFTAKLEPLRINEMGFQNFCNKLFFFALKFQFCFCFFAMFWDVGYELN
jgi:hypothetical protein